MSLFIATQTGSLPTHSERKIPTMACRAQRAQPETRPELACCCQKELLLNVRGFASPKKRNFNAFVEWIYLPAHQILSVNSPPTGKSNYLMAVRLQQNSPQQSWLSQITNCPTCRGIWRRVNAEWVRHAGHDTVLLIADLIRTWLLSLKRIYSSLIWVIWRNDWQVEAKWKCTLRHMHKHLFCTFDWFFIKDRTFLQVYHKTSMPICTLKECIK